MNQQPMGIPSSHHLLERGTPPLALSEGAHFKSLSAGEHLRALSPGTSPKELSANLDSEQMTQEQLRESIDAIVQRVTSQVNDILVPGEKMQ